MKAVVSLLTCAVMLLAVAPSKAFAQTLSHNAAGEQTLGGGATARRKRDLKARFAEEVADAGGGTLTAAGMERLERERLRAQSTSKANSFSNKHVVLAVVVVVVIVGLAIVLAHNGVDPKPSCNDEPLTPGCVP